jgi:WD40 repeat protein
LRVEPYGDVLSGHLGTIRDIVAVPMPDGRALIATAADDGTVRLWHPAHDLGHPAPPKGGWFRTSTGVDPALAVTSVAAGALPDGRAWLATASRDEWVRLWHPEHGTLVRPPIDPQVDRTTWFTGTAAVAAVPMPDGSALLATGSGHVVRLVDPATGSPGAAAELGRIDWRRWGSGKPVNALLLREEQVARIAPVVAMAGLLPPGGSPVLAVAGGRTVQFWDVTRRLGLRKLPQQARSNEDVRLVALLSRATGEPLLAMATDGTLQFFHAGTAAALSVHPATIRALAAVPKADGSTMLATGDEDGAIRLWSAETCLPSGEPVGGHRGPVRAIVAGRGLLVSGGDDRTLRWWDPERGVAVRALPLGVAVSGLAISGPMLFVATGEGLLRMDLDKIAGT